MNSSSVTASPGITTTATTVLQNVQSVLKTIAVKGAPNIVSSICASLEAMELAIWNLRERWQQDTSQMMLSEEIKSTLQMCGERCQQFESQVENWTENAKKDKTFWKGKWEPKLLGIDQIETFGQLLGYCKDILHVAFSIAKVFKSYRDEDLLLEDLQSQVNDMMLGVKQRKARANMMAKQTEATIKQCTDSRGDDLSELRKSREELYGNLESQIAVLNNWEKMCADASKAASERAGKKIKDASATNHSRLVIGRVGSREQELGFRQTISGVVVDDSSSAFVGVFSDVYLNPQ